MLLRNSGKATLDNRKEDSRSSVPVVPERTLWCHCYHHCPEDSVNNTCRFEAHLSISQYSRVTVPTCRCQVRSHNTRCVSFLNIITTKLSSILSLSYPAKLLGISQDVEKKLVKLAYNSVYCDPSVIGNTR